MAGREYRLTILVSGRDTGAKSMLGGLGSALGSIGSIAGGILTAGLLTRLGQGILSLGNQALDATASWERMGMAITTMSALELRNADSTLTMSSALELARDKSKELMDWIQKLAIESPFDSESIANAFRQAMTYGFVSDEAKKLTGILVDMSSGMGLSNDKLGLISYALGQIHQSDKLLMLDLRQLMNAGVPVNDILKTMGFTLNDVGKEAISTSDFIAAFEKKMGTDFAGAAKLQAASWAGLKSSISDIKNIGLREFFSSFFTTVQPLVNTFVQKFSDPAFQESLRKWGEPLGELAQKFVGFFSQVSTGNFDLGAMIVGWSEAFKKGARNIDWKAVSNQISAGIDSIDWAKLGQQIRTFSANIWKGVSFAVSEINWVEIGGSLGGGFANLLAGLTGQGNAQNVIDTWINNITASFDIAARITMNMIDTWINNVTASFDIAARITMNMILGAAAIRAGIASWQTETANGIANWIIGTRTSIANWQIDTINNIVLSTSGMGLFIKTAIMLWSLPVNEGWAYIKGLFAVKATETVGTIPGAMAGGSGMISSQIISWLPAITSSLNIIKNEFIQKAQSWITQSAATVSALGKQLVDAVTKLLKAVLAAIVPITIKIGVDIPNFELLAEQVKAGMKLLANVGGGGSGGGGGGSTAGQNGSGANSNAQHSGGNIHQYANGGISTGPLSGYHAILHGTEAVVPLQGGSIPVSLGQLNPSGGSGMTMININVVYSPMVSTASQHEVHDIFAPMIAEAARAEFGKRNL